MDFQRISDKLNDALIENLKNNYPTINAGGCGVVAYNLAKELSSLGFDAKIAWLDVNHPLEGYEERFNDLLNRDVDIDLHYLNDNGFRCAHCMVLIDGNYIDADGVVNKLVGMWGDTYPHTTTLEWELLKSLVENEVGWNKTFDRELIPEVIEKIKKVVDNLVN